MLGQPDPDPGGDTPGAQSSREITDLKDQNEHQQVLIAQLKEMLRKEQSTVPQEKVEEYINTLSKAKAKKSRLKKDDSGSTERSSSSMDSRKHEKVNLMKQQLEENKAKLAQRGLRQKDIEDMVTVLKAQLSQPINSAPANVNVLEKNLDYNKNTSPEELYNILIVKEKRITDLLEKNQKQEASILDLQENLKEKDSVIDARTKAITLMTENLSKKGKVTLDNLDETKEQMRKMQENFVTLESEMKARQMVLLNDLKSKNIEIADLQEQNEKLLEETNKLRNQGHIEKPETDNHELIIKDLKSKLDESRSTVEQNNATIEEFKIKIEELEKKLKSNEESGSKNQNNEVEKLKKQLDESNKNMIKVKAQNKSKIKDLNKKLDGFKKMSDANATIIQLQNEITKLNEKIAELEEEKGNMQLKMVESIESFKGSTNSDDLRELEEKLENNKEELEEKDKVICLLEADIISLKSEITDLNDKISGFSQLKNEQVTSEIQSIQIEEQLEILQTTNKELQSEIDSLRKQKEELIEKIEEFTKEKVELVSKLDNYVQENMDLIDKLEKLSAEKVSSAESIEMVEGLTQQEKLELAAYQKNMDTNLEDPVKSQEEEQEQEPPAELNESVLQLTEETAELLKKIEMFTMERKEVMAKLESLREENNLLSLKVNEIENNRDILAETYEQVQTEKDELVKENENLVLKLRELENHDPTGVQDSNDDSAKLQQLQKQYEVILEENNNLKKTLKEHDAKIHEKDNLESKLAETKKRIDELELKLKENLEEIANYQSIIEDNKIEFINSSNIINQLQNQLAERENDVQELNTLMNDLNNVVSELQEANSKLDNFDTLEKEVEELRSSLTDQIQLAQSQAEEFKEELDFNKSVSEQEIEKKNREINRLEQEITHKEGCIANLKEQLKEKDRSVSAAIEEMKQKYIGLQNQLDNNSGSLEKQVEDLSHKNREQLEKMKKIAANLKKKTQAYLELEGKYNEEKEKWETEVNRKETDSKDAVAQLTKELDDLKEEINRKSAVLEKSETKVQDLLNIVSTLEDQNIDLQNMLHEVRQKQEKVSEVSLKQELSTSLHEEFDNLNSSKESINEDKIKELQLIIETNEAELQHFKERSQMLEQDLSVLLEEKENLLAKSMQLEEKLSSLSRSVEEKSILEEEMDHKLQEVAANDEALTKRVEELSKENKDLTDKTREQEELIMKLKIKIKKVQEKISQTKTLQAALDEQEQANNELNKQIAQLEVMQKQIHQEYEEKQKQNQIDYERIESDYQLQLEGLVRSRNDLTFECEKLLEDVKNLKEKEEELVMELTETNQKLSDVENQYNDQIKTLTENLNQTSTNWKSAVQQVEAVQTELQALKAQILTDVAKNTVEDVISDATDQFISTCSKDTQTETVETPVVQTTQPVAAQDFFQQDFPPYNMPDWIPQQPSFLFFGINQRQESPTHLVSDTADRIVSSSSKDSHTESVEAPVQMTRPVAVHDFFQQDFPVYNLPEGQQQGNWFSSTNSQQKPPEAVQDFFQQGFQEPQQQQQQGINVTKDDLENKIRALEMLLYNVDQEKEEVIQECSDMLNELTRLVYEKVQNVSHTNLSTVPSVGSLQPVSDLESQILSSEEIDALDDPIKLQRLEFEEADPCLGQQELPVEEKVGPPSTAYLTYQPNQPLVDLETQIISSSDIDSLNDPLKLQQLEFEMCDPLLGQQTQPVVERLAQPSKAYLTYQVGEAIGENDDGWGWGPEEARLEEEHQYKTENTPQIQALRAEIQDLNARIQTLQTEKDHHIEEIKQLQLKSGKLIKKCKELKLKNDQLVAKSKPDTGDFFNLDETIQEELKTQVEQLETKIKEMTSELEKEKQEKMNLFKKIDTLNASSEKILETKQIQDSEIYRWKRKYEEVQEKLDHLDWGSDELKSPKKQPAESNENIPEDVEELKKLVQDLTVDNEELQALLNDQKQQRMRLERSKSVGNEERVKNLEEDVLNKEAFINGLTKERDKIVEESKEQSNLIKSLNERLKQLEGNEVVNVLENRLKPIEERLEWLQNEYDEKCNIVTELEKGIINLRAVNDELNNLLMEKDSQLENNAQLEDLKRLLLEKTDLADQFQHSNDSLTQEISTLRDELETVKLEFDNLQANTTQIITNLQNQLQGEDINTMIQQVTQFRANSVTELIELFNLQHSNLENLKSNQEEADRLLASYNERILELERELLDKKQQFQDLQVSTSKNILELQTELDEHKQKNDQLQVENHEKLKELSEELEKERRKQFDLSSDKSDKENATHTNELKALIEELQLKKSELEAEINTLKDNLKDKQQELDKVVIETENKLVDTVTELEEKWAAQVDERGNTVADSWKYHLSIVESDFAAMQDKLKNEINELEEKCNALVNENNELRKNVDTEIKNEVDRISALQQQINDRQHAINELKQLLTSEQIEKAALAQQLVEFDRIQQLLADREVEYASLKTLADTTRQQFDEKREVVEEIVKILESNTSFPLSCEKQDILTEMQRQLSSLTDKKNEVDNLNSQLQKLNSQLQNCNVAIQEREAEILRLKETKEKQISEKMEEIASLNQSVELLKNQMQQVGQKDEVIIRLESLTEEYKNQLSNAQQEIHNLQQYYGQSNHVVEDYKQQLEEVQQSCISLQKLVEEKDQQIVDLNQQVVALTQQIANLTRQLEVSTDNKETERLDAELAQTKDAYLVLQQSLAECQQQLFNITQDLATKSHQFEIVSEQLAYSQHNSDLLQEEINKLNQTLQIKEQEYAVSLENMEKSHYKELESHYEEVLSAKDLDIQTLRAQVAESIYNTSEHMKMKNLLEDRIRHLEIEVQELSTAKNTLESNILEHTSLGDEETKQLTEMRGIIEEQVVKIEELKKELFGKSNDYDSLIAEMDISRKAITQQPTSLGLRSENPSAVSEERQPIPEDDLSEPVNRAELDLALYMLHQRDVRCEELTVELTHLLEERDTLQLRLSNALREKEQLVRSMKKVEGSTELQTSLTEVVHGTPKSSRSSEIFLAASGTELASEPSEKLTVDQNLANKLSELRTVGYKKDKTFVDEQEQRRMQQISIMQQHIKEASKLPPEAAAKLVDASYTLSRDVQSPSKVLLNWLWGRSTPKVNDT